MSEACYQDSGQIAKAIDGTRSDQTVLGTELALDEDGDDRVYAPPTAVSRHVSHNALDRGYDGDDGYI